MRIVLSTSKTWLSKMSSKQGSWFLEFFVWENFHAPHVGLLFCCSQYTAAMTSSQKWRWNLKIDFHDNLPIVFSFLTGQFSYKRRNRCESLSKFCQGMTEKLLLKVRKNSSQKWPIKPRIDFWRQQSTIFKNSRLNFFQFITE